MGAAILPSPSVCTCRRWRWSQRQGRDGFFSYPGLHLDQHTPAHAAPCFTAQNVMFLDSFGSLLAEEGSVEEAVSVLQKSVQLEPEEGHMKYMCVGRREGRGERRGSDGG